MRKKLCHFLFIVVLILISFNHYKFAKYDKRNNLDIDSEIYVSSSVDYSYTFYGKEISISVPLYNKIIGFILYVFGKNYFVLKMSYLLFLLFFLISLYCIVFKIFRSLEMSLVVVLMHLVIPGFISYSRMCWPQLYSSSLVLFSVLFLYCFFDENKKNIYSLFLFFVISCLACFMHYSSFMYICLFLLYCIFLQKERSHFLLKSHFAVVVSLLIVSIMFLIYYYQDWTTLLLGRVVFFKTFSFKNFFFIFIHTDSFFFTHQFYLFWFGILFILGILFIQKKVCVLNKLYIFFLACLITVLFYFVPYSIKVTVFALTSGIIILSYFLVFKANFFVRYFLYIYLFIAFIILNINPQYFIKFNNKTPIKDKIALMIDNRNWGIEELEVWAKTINRKNVLVFSFYNSFYPENSVNYITYFDLKMLSQEKDINLLSNDKRIDYIIFDDIYPEAYNSFFSEQHLCRYKYVKKFLQKSLNFEEVKRIKCPLKDIVIYKTFSVTKTM